MTPFIVKNEDVKQTMQIQPIFPTPVGFLQMDKALNKKILEFIKIKQLKFIKNPAGNSISSDVYILDNDELSDIKKVLTDSVNEYFKKIVNPGKDMKLNITTSWINVNKNGEAHHLHKHTNSMVSGVLYIDTCEGDTISFSNENSEVFGNLKFNDIPKTKWTVHEWDIPAINNRLIIFPSSLLHFVKPRPNTCTGSRISLSFNTWIKGDTWVAESRSQ